MKRLNFRILNEPGIQLESWRVGESGAAKDLGETATLRWDLHNFADFIGFTYHAAQAELRLEWVAVQEQTNPWGDEGNHNSGCALRFSDVSYLAVTPRDPQMPATEDLALEWCGSAEKGSSTENTWEYPHSDVSTVFRLAFHGGMAIEVVAAAAELLSKGSVVSED